MKKLGISLLLLFFVMNSAVSQGEFGHVTPQTAEIMRIGEVPVSLYTGNINLDIPIYQIKDQDFDVSISLHYTSDGFKPTARSGAAGYNWIINAGGVITREIYGVPDDMFGAKAFRRVEIPVGFWWATACNPLSIQGLDSVFNSTSENLPLVNNPGRNCIPELLADGSPDLYSFSFMGHRGHFSIGFDRSIILSHKGYQIDLSGLGEQPRMITPPPYPGGCLPQPSTIRIVAPDGYIYIFGGGLETLEFSKPFTPGDYEEYKEPAILAWHLSKIIAPNGRCLLFTYKKVELTSKINPIWQSTEIRNHGSENSFTAIKTVLLESIKTLEITGGTEVLFEYEEDNNEKSIFGYLDYNNSSYKLSKITIKPNLNTTYEHALEYEYNRNKRFLKKLLLFEGEETYSFTYNHRNYPMSYDASLKPDSYWKEDPNPTRSSGLINKIVYPTGGSASFIYERNIVDSVLQRDMSSLHASLVHYPAYAEGCRIKKIIYRTGNKVSHEKEYFYLNRYSWGSQETPPTQDLFASDGPDDRPPFEYKNGDYRQEVDDTSLRSSTLPFPVSSSGIYYRYPPSYEILTNGQRIYMNENWYKNYNIPEPAVGYSEVAECLSDSSYTIYRFVDYNSNSRTALNSNLRYMPTVDDYASVILTMDQFVKGIHNRGQILEKRTYNNHRDLISSQKINYQMRVDSLPKESDNIWSLSPTGEPAGGRYNMIKRSIALCHFPEIRKETINNGVHLIDSLFYNEKDILCRRLTKGKIIDDLEEITFELEEETIKYANDYSTSIGQNMTWRNMISWPIERSIKRGNTIQQERNHYKKFNLYFVIDSVEISKGGDFYTNAKYQYNHNNDRVQSVTGVDGITTVYIWGYLNQYPVAEIRNTTYDVVSDALGASLISSLSFYPFPSESDMNQINNLRTNPSFSNSLITTYEYNPGIGLAKMIDPRGIVSYYEYDDLGRLQRIHDDDGNDLEGYEYHYVN